MNLSPYSNLVIHVIALTRDSISLQILAPRVPCNKSTQFQIHCKIAAVEVVGAYRGNILECMLGCRPFLLLTELIHIAWRSGSLFLQGKL